MKNKDIIKKTKEDLKNFNSKVTKLNIDKCNLGKLHLEENLLIDEIQLKNVRKVDFEGMVYISVVVEDYINAKGRCY